MHVVIAANRCLDRTRVGCKPNNRSSWAGVGAVVWGPESVDPRSVETRPVSRKRPDVLVAFGDPDGKVFAAWEAKENTRDLYTL
jgi:hypothetical protein